MDLTQISALLCNFSLIYKKNHAVCNRKKSSLLYMPYLQGHTFGSSVFKTYPKASPFLLLSDEFSRSGWPPNLLQVKHVKYLSSYGDREKDMNNSMVFVLYKI